MFFPSSENENYTIYTTILNTLQPFEGKTIVKVNKKSILADFSFDRHEFNKSSFYSFLLDSETPKFIKKDTTWYDVLEKFNAISKERIKFKNYFDSNLKIELWHKWKFIKDSDKFWKRFYKKFPSAIGFAGFSNITYSDDKTKAVVYFQISRNGLNASGELFFLKKVSENWIIVQIHPIWVA